MTHKILKNAVISGTVSSLALVLFFAFRRVRIAIPYVWFWAVLAALSYGFLATKLSIFGKGHIVISNWKNVLLALVLFIGALVGSLKLDPLFDISPDTSTAVALAVLAAMVLSDALAA